MIVQNYYDIDPRVRREAECLVDRGHEVEVICLQMPGQKERIYTLNGVKVCSVPLSKKRGSKLRYLFEYLLFFVLACFQVSWLSWRRRYQIVQVHTLPDFLLFAAVVPKLLGARLILDMHEVMPEFYASKFGIEAGSSMIGLIKLAEKLSTHFADAVITINEPIKQVLEERGIPPQKITVIMNVTDDKLFPLTGGEVTRPANSEIVLMYHGTLTFIYGLDIALRALTIAREQVNNLEFWVFGDGPEKQNLQRLATELGLSDVAQFKGVLPQESVFEFIAQCDIGLLPTRQDAFLDLSFSNKLGEYIFMGKPVIASRLRTIRSYFDEEAIVYFRPHDEQDLARCIVALAQNPQKRAQVSAYASAAYTQISWPKMKERYYALIDMILAD